MNSPLKKWYHLDKGFGELRQTSNFRLPFSLKLKTNSTDFFEKFFGCKKGRVRKGQCRVKQSGLFEKTGYSREKEKRVLIVMSTLTRRRVSVKSLNESPTWASRTSE